jgi:nucleotide-binding universal stress UspA family protein
MLEEPIAAAISDNLKDRAAATFAAPEPATLPTRKALRVKSLKPGSTNHMAQKTILFPTDFSTASDAALVHAETIARQTGARLLIVHVEEPPLAYGGGELYYGLPEPDSERILKMLEDVKPSDPSVPYAHRLTMGDPAGEVVRIATDENAEMIILGTHGRTGMTRLLMGSVAEAIVRRAPCPVLVYREVAERLARKKAAATA